MKFFSAQNFFYLVSNNREFLDEAIIILKVYTKIGPWYSTIFIFALVVEKNVLTVLIRKQPELIQKLKV